MLRVSSEVSDKLVGASGRLVTGVLSWGKRCNGMQVYSGPATVLSRCRQNYVPPSDPKGQPGRGDTQPGRVRARVQRPDRLRGELPRQCGNGPRTHSEGVQPGPRTVYEVPPKPDPEQAVTQRHDARSTVVRPAHAVAKQAELSLRVR